MAGNIIAGFVKGATGQALDSMQRREAAEAEMKKAEMLERLRRETAKELAVFEEGLPSKQLARKSAEQEMDLRERTAELNERKFGLDELNTRSQIESRARDDARQERYTSAAISNMGRSGRRGGSGLDSDNDVLMAEYNNAFKELQSAGANPSVLANFQTEWYEGVNNKNWSKEQQRKFLLAMRRSFTSEWEDPKGRKRRPLLETYTTANSRLDSLLGD